MPASRRGSRPQRFWVVGGPTVPTPGLWWNCLKSTSASPAGQTGRGFWRIPRGVEAQQAATTPTPSWAGRALAVPGVRRFQLTHSGRERCRAPHHRLHENGPEPLSPGHDSLPVWSAMSVNRRTRHSVHSPPGEAWESLAGRLAFRVHSGPNGHPLSSAERWP